MEEVRVGRCGITASQPLCHTNPGSTRYQSYRICREISAGFSPLKQPYVRTLRACSAKFTEPFFRGRSWPVSRAHIAALISRRARHKFRRERRKEGGKSVKGEFDPYLVNSFHLVLFVSLDRSLWSILAKLE